MRDLPYRALAGPAAALRLAAGFVWVGLGGCASPPAEPVRAAQAPADCVAVTGTSICRRPGSGHTGTVQAVSGEVLRNQADPITGPTPGRVGN